MNNNVDVLEFKIFNPQGKENWADDSDVYEAVEIYINGKEVGGCHCGYISYEVDITDTIKSYKLAINIRNTIEYPYSNIYFYMNTILPNGKVTKCDTIECYLAYPDGTWKGKGNSKIRDNRFWIAKNIKFEQKGKYTFELRQATIDSTLKGICDVGLHLEYQD